MLSCSVWQNPLNVFVDFVVGVPYPSQTSLTNPHPAVFLPPRVAITPLLHQEDTSISSVSLQLFAHTSAYDRYPHALRLIAWHQTDENRAPDGPLNPLTRQVCFSAVLAVWRLAEDHVLRHSLSFQHGVPCYTSNLCVPTKHVLGVDCLSLAEFDSHVGYAAYTDHQRYASLYIAAHPVDIFNFPGLPRLGR